MKLNDKARPCPFCGMIPLVGLSKKTGCQLHGDPIQYITISCKNRRCQANPNVKGGDIYAIGQSGEYLAEGKENALELALKYWNRTDANGGE